MSVKHEDDDCPYQVIRRLGQGAQGDVQLVSIDGQQYALKTIRDPFHISIIEIDLLTRLRHPYVLNRERDLITGICNIEDGIGYFLPPATGDLTGVVKGLKPSNFYRYFYQLLSALEFIHSHGIIHCDIKPENVLIFGDRAVLADFGISYQSVDGTFHTDRLKYSEPYRPFIDTQRQLYTTASDIWALGITMLEILGARLPPFAGSDMVTQEEIDRYLLILPDDIRNLFSPMLRLLPEQRATAEELLQLSIFRQFPRVEGYIIPPPSTEPLPTTLVHRSMVQLLQARLGQYPLALALALDLFQRLVALSPETLLMVLVDIVSYMATEYYGIYDFDPPNGVSKYLQLLGGYIYRGV